MPKWRSSSWSRRRSSLAERYRATVEYDGSRFFGFQRQVAEQVTVQGELENALYNLVHNPVTVHGAGRTDSGVHARGQVIAFDLPHWAHGAQVLQNALNAHLPADIAVRDVQPAAPDFHPRFAAHSRTYRYTIWNAPVRSPLRHSRSWHVYAPLDVAAMHSAAQTLVGPHDFATFGTPPQGENSVRTVYAARCWRDAAEPALVLIEMRANAFLKRMVRLLVGTLRLVGDGAWDEATFAAALAARDIRQAGQAAPPQGLVLEEVCYERE